MPDLGETISAPFLRLVPLTVRPNSITLGNGVLNLFQLVVAMISVCPSLASDDACSVSLQRAACVVCAATTAASTVLDCLDGMQARRTQQTSVFGRALDHFLDGLHIPMLGISFALVARVSILPVVFITLMVVATYTSQLIVENLTRRDLGAPGVGSQLALAGLFAAMACGVQIRDYHVRMLAPVIALPAGWTILRHVLSAGTGKVFTRTVAYLVTVLSLPPPLAAVAMVVDALAINGRLVVATAKQHHIKHVVPQRVALRRCTLLFLAATLTESKHWLMYVVLLYELAFALILGGLHLLAVKPTGGKAAAGKTM